VFAVQMTQAEVYFRSKLKDRQMELVGPREARILARRGAAGSFKMLVFLISPKNDPVVNKKLGQSPCAHHMIGGRLVCICQLPAHSLKIAPPFINN
jgi:hypothetical protein